MKEKQLYTAPAADLLVVRFEENVMSPAYGAKGAAGGSLGLDDDENDYGSF